MACLGAVALGGCATTQQEAVRLQLNSARLRATEVPTRVARRNPQVGLAGVSVVPGTDGAAMVVVVRNPGPSATGDLPISVGWRTAHGGRRYLNAAAGLDYFQTHVPPIAPGTALAWVFTTRRRLPAGARPFAEVGLSALNPADGRGAAPRISAVATPGRGRSLRVTVHNGSSVPQYQLRVYAVARQGAQLLAAGTASIAHLSAGASATLSLRLFGRAGATSIALSAPPTIFG